eukprot:1364029-Prymnesium_polylepis.1
MAEARKIREEEHTRALDALREEIAKFKAIAEPDKRRFLKSGAFSSEVDLAIIRCLQLGVSRGKAPSLFLIFARLFGITLPGRRKKVPGPHVDGKHTTVWRYV